MKEQTKYTILLVLFFSILALPNLTLAQDWSDAQKAVWKNVETYWNLWTQGDLEGMMTYYHERYKGWGNDSPLPRGKDAAEKGLKYFSEGNKIILHQIDPAAIEVHGSFAFVHYYFSFVYKNAEGKDQNVRGRWTDILTKQGDKWVLIGDHGGTTSGN